MKRVVVTGADGFLGSKLVNCLLASGISVCAMDISITPQHLKQCSHLEYVRCDFTDIQGTIAKIRFDGFDAMYHLAWAGVSTTDKNNPETQMQNIGILISALQLAAGLHCTKFICTGSVSEYAYCGEIVDGHQTPFPSDMYAACKVACHFIGDIYAKQLGLDFIWLLVSSIYGPEREDNNLITYTINSLLSGSCPDFTGLEQQWDYLYVDDLIRALCCVGHLGKGGKVYPVGSGVVKPLYEYVKIIRDAINPDLSLGIGNLPYKSQQIDHSRVDITEIQNDCGFTPCVSFQDGIQRTIDYFRARGARIHEL